MDFEYRDILEQPLEKEELNELANLGSTSIKGLLNPGSKGFKELKLDLDKINDQEAAELIKKNPKIMKRPLLTDGKNLALGFKIEEYEALIQ